MTEQDQQIALSEWFGCVRDTSSLDVLHEIEKRLNSNDRVKYYWMLAKVVNPMELATKCTFSLIHATPVKRREALLRTLGLWKNS